MPRYKVLEKSFINDSIAEEGDIIEFNGKPSSNLELIEEAKGKAPAKKKEDAFE